MKNLTKNQVLKHIIQTSEDSPVSVFKSNRPNLYDVYFANVTGTLAMKKQKINAHLGDFSQNDDINYVRSLF